MFEETGINYSTVLNGINIPAAVFDSERRLVDFNADALEIRPDFQDRVGESAEELLADEVSDTFDEVSNGETVEREVNVSYGEDVMRFNFRVSQVDSAYIVTVLEQTEQADTQKKLKSLEKQLDQLTSMLSHDTKTPLMVAEGRIEIVLNSLDSDRFEDEIESLKTAEESIEQIERLITDVVDLFSEGKSDVTKKPIGFKITCEEAWDEYVKDDSATLNIESNGVVYADRSKLKLLLGNLFKNSVDHNEGPVTVTAEFNSDGFTVCDDGEGFETDNPEELFEFGATTRQNGSGVGLTIVETVIDSHGWTISVSETESGGAKFEVKDVMTGDGESRVDVQVIDD